MSNQITAEQLAAAIAQNGQILQYLVAKELGHTYNDQEFQEKAGDALMDLLTKAPAAYQTAQPLHGSTGTFSVSGLERDIVSAHVRPYGLANELPLFPSVDESPQYGALTGVSDDIGGEPANPCSDAPTGYVKGATLTAQFGYLSRQTDTIDIHQTAARINRGDFTDLMLHGFRLGMEVNAGMYPRGLNPSQAVNLVTMSQMVGVGERLYRKLVPQTWQGSPANNNAGGGYKEFPGLDNQIKTGQVDAVSNTAVPALDSYVKSFAYQLVSVASLVSEISMMHYYLTTLAEDTGMGPVNWVLCMRPQLFFELTAVWPLTYNTDKVSALTGNSRLMVDGTDMTRQRDDMRNNKYLIVNGERVDVVLDVGIYEQNSTNDANLGGAEYASSIYMVPLTVNGNMPVAYREYFDYRAAQLSVNLLRSKEDFWTDNGVFSWALEQIKWCINLTARTQQRVVLRTPQFAGRLDNVKYIPLEHLREFDPDSPYHKNGGVSLRAAGNKYAAWL